MLEKEVESLDNLKDKNNNIDKLRSNNNTNNSYSKHKGNIDDLLEDINYVCIKSTQKIVKYNKKSNKFQHQKKYKKLQKCREN